MNRYAVLLLCSLSNDMRLPLIISCPDGASSTSSTSSVLVLQGELCLVEVNGTLAAANDVCRIANERVGKLTRAMERVES